MFSDTINRGERHNTSLSDPWSSICFIRYQGFEPCRCFVRTENGPEIPCRAGLRVWGGRLERLVYDIVLSRPEDYLSIYQSGCNHNCLKCHSWYFAQIAQGRWYSAEDLTRIVLEYREYVTVWKHRNRATMWHASDLCSHCGSCVIDGKRGPYCPGILRSDQVLLSPQGYGPARNIVSMTGGDLYCQPAFYIDFFRRIKREAPDMLIHIETNGYGLTPKNLELLYEADLDSIWLDMKAYSRNIYEYLCGTHNDWILELPAKIIDMGIILEIVLLYIPDLVEIEEIRALGRIIANVSRDIPTMLLAFFPQYLMSGYREPTIEEMVLAYKALREEGLRKVKVGNIGVFCKTSSCIDRLIDEIGREALAL
ncbi:Radical SAM domain protein [Ignisphaera aggregans DSM 17230]|uniref:Radical SAM domain protein n=1 Tax=Ignisphaera aggregans (strain DSM 17230 / JCM 13409 / AQ1.S1) TaxID=583356 RepID=E0STP8_IGNAA|nr:Radical SAM domain protein [Ignisphaera aggregans DSM 17230]